MKRSSLTEFEIEEEGLKLRICRNTEKSGNGGQAAIPYQTVPAFVPPPTEEPKTTEPTKTKEQEEGMVVINSPIVGTFYSSPSPESPSFVKEGDTISSDTIVCIIEAMKVMNEIPAELSGTITQVLIENGDTVEYGQPLFKVKQS
tara:strand:- start:2830 stop:3264 length:435 start_codon:yes stop_codon:yes gene_type:complete